MSTPFAEGLRTQTFEAQRDAVMAAIEVRVGMPTGPRGEEGPPGVEGRGTQWLTGSGPPDYDLQAEENDLYLDTLSGNVYVRTTLNWVQRSNIMGPPGPPGQTADAITTGQRDMTGDLSPTSIDPANTGVLLLTRTGNVVTWDFRDLLLTPGAGTLSLLAGLIPVGFRSEALVMGTASRRNSSTLLQWLTVNLTTISWLSEQNIGSGGGTTTTTRPSVGITGQMSYVVTSDFPTVLPGVPR